jgi:hypothetical protein
MDRCPSCEGAVAPEDRTCPSCGARLTGATASFEPVAAEEAPAGYDGTGTEGPVLVVHKGAEVGERFYLEGTELTVGRDPECDIFLNDVTVSRQHARLLVSSDGVSVEDEGSLNGTYVNDVLVDKARLHNGDALQIGRFRMIFLSGGGA